MLSRLILASSYSIALPESTKLSERKPEETPALDPFPERGAFQGIAAGKRGWNGEMSNTTEVPLVKIIPKPGTKSGTWRHLSLENGIPPVNVMNSGEAREQKDRNPDFQTATSFQLYFFLPNSLKLQNNWFSRNYIDPSNCAFKGKKNSDESWQNA